MNAAETGGGRPRPGIAGDADGGWIDISLPIRATSVPWAGLASPIVAPVAAIGAGDSVNVGVLTACLHTATHADAPFHVADAGATIDRVGLDAYLGPARLVRLAGGGPIDAAALAAAGLPADGPWPARLLLATGQPYDGEHWPAAAPYLTPDAAAACVAGGVRLVGLDVPSVDPLDSRALVAHHTLLGGGVAIVENLRLAGLAPGAYWLAAVPLAIVGGDASPIRAVVRPLDDGAP